MTRKDYLLLKSWGDHHPEAPHLPNVGINICIACIPDKSDILAWGPHTCKEKQPNDT